MQRYNNTVTSPTGQAIAGASILVTVAANPAGSGANATLYSDDGITPTANPVVADNLGRFGFYVASGKYDLTASGGNPPITLPFVLANVEITDHLEFRTGDTTPLAAQTLNLTELTAGSTPPSGSIVLYSKLADSRLYYKDATGTEIGPLVPGGGGGGTPGGSMNSLQRNSGSGTFIGSAIFDNGSTINTIEDTNFIGPNPYLDIRSFGARNAFIQGTQASCTSGSPVVGTGINLGFLNGDGIAIYGCGPAATVSALAAPAVVSGNSQSLLVPDSPIATNITAGSLTYSYLGVAKDINGGLAPAGAATTITTGQPLGLQTASVQSASLTGNSLTLTFGSAPNLGPGNGSGALFHFFNSSNALLSGWFQVTGTTATTITSFNVANYSGGPNTTITSTGGTIDWYNGNQLTFTTTANLKQIFVCAQRPGDSSFHVIGTTHIVVPGTTDAAALTFTDWGSTITVVPGLPAYVSDSICSAASSTNGILSSTVVSGAGTSTLTLANNAGNTASNQKVFLDNGPAMRAASTAAAATGATVYIPSVGHDTNSNRFAVYSPVGFAAPVKLNGGLFPSETMFFGSLTGTLGVVSAGQFAWEGYSLISNNGAYPVVAQGGANLIRGVQISAGNNGWAYFNYNPQYSSQIDCTFITGTGGDFSGMAMFFAPTAFNNQISRCAILTGPNQVNDSSWVPAVYFMNTGGSIASFDEVSVQDRGIYAQFTINGSWPIHWEVGKTYGQGIITPTYSVFNGTPSDLYFLGPMLNDTSPSPIYATWGSGSNNNTVQMVVGLQTTSQEAHGFPLPYSGNQQAIPRINLNPFLSSFNYPHPFSAGIGNIFQSAKPTVWTPNLLLVGTTFSTLGAAINGQIVYCSDCTIANPCAGGGTGAIAKYLNGIWVCN